MNYFWFLFHWLWNGLAIYGALCIIGAYVNDWRIRKMLEERDRFYE